MNAAMWRLGGAALIVLSLMAGSGWAAWEWQANSYSRQLAEQSAAYQKEREDAATAVIDWQDAQQNARRELEDRLQANDQTHYQELSDARKDQVRLRDRLATADMRLSVLVDADESAGGCTVPAGSGAGGVVHGRTRARLDPAAAQRIIAIAGDGDQGLIALQACQAYAREISTLKQ